MRNELSDPELKPLGNTSNLHKTYKMHIFGWFFCFTHQLEPDTAKTIKKIENLKKIFLWFLALYGLALPHPISWLRGHLSKIASMAPKYAHSDPPCQISSLYDDPFGL